MLPDWRSRLDAWIDSQRRGALAYGSHDCALFVAGAVRAMTGTDHAAAFRGRYATLKEGLERVQQAGFIDHLDMVASLFDEIIPPITAQVGDIAVVDGAAGQPSLGIVGGSRIFVLLEHGLATTDLTFIRRAFRVA